MAQQGWARVGGGDAPGGLPPPPPPPGARSPWPLVFVTLACVVAGIVLVAGYVALFVLADRASDDVGQGMERAAITELPKAADDLIEALQDERSLATMDVVGLGDAPFQGDVPVADTPTARAETDAARSEFEAVLADADRAGRSHYQSALDALDVLQALRSEADAAMPGATMENLPTSVEISDRYGELVDVLLDANDSLISTIDEPELRSGLDLLSQAQRQRGTVRYVILRFMPATLTPTLSPEEVTDLASVTAELEAGRTAVMERAAGTVYETAAIQLDQELDAAGLQQVLEATLATGQSDLAPALTAITDTSFAWRTFARSVDSTLRVVIY